MCTCFWCCWVLLFQLQWMQNFCCRRRCCCCCLLQLLFTHRFSCIYIFLLILLSFRLFGLVDVQWWVHHFTNQRVDQFHQFRAVRQAVFDCHKSDGFRHRTSALIAHILLKWIMWMPMPVRLCCIYEENIEYIEYIYIDCLQPSVCNTIHQCVVCLHNNNWSSMMPIHTIVAKRYARRVRKIASNNNNNNIDWHICKTHKRALCETNVHCNYSKLNVSFMSRLSPHTSYFFTHCTMQKFCATAQRCTHTHTHSTCKCIHASNSLTLPSCSCTHYSLLWCGLLQKPASQLNANGTRVRENRQRQRQWNSNKHKHSICILIIMDAHLHFIIVCHSSSSSNRP